MKNYDRVLEEVQACAAADFIAAPRKPWAIMALSAPPEKNGEVLLSEWTTENVERIEVATQYVREHPEWRDDLPYLILNGEANQLPMMLECALGQYYPSDRILLVDCGRRPSGNTQTQFTVLHDDARFALPTTLIVCVTSWYHVPRVTRTITANSPKNLIWYMLARPAEESRLHVLPHIIHGEAKRITTYSEKGWIADEPFQYLR